MNKAHYEILADDEGYYGEIPGFQGVYASASTLGKCRDGLQETLEDWVLFRISKNLNLPEVSGLSLKVKETA